MNKGIDILLYQKMAATTPIAIPGGLLVETPPPTPSKNPTPPSEKSPGLFRPSADPRVILRELNKTVPALRKKRQTKHKGTTKASRQYFVDSADAKKESWVKFKNKR